jgi:hypothetical protein
MKFLGYVNIVVLPPMNRRHFYFYFLIRVKASVRERILFWEDSFCRRKKVFLRAIVETFSLIPCFEHFYFIFGAWD